MTIKMNNMENILLIMGFVAMGSVIFYMSYAFVDIPIITEKFFPQDVNLIRHIVRHENVTNDKLFIAMADITKYPIIFPDNYVSVEILNKTNDTIYTKEIIKYSDLERTLIVKHTIISSTSHKIEVIDGVAKGTIIDLNYQKQDEGTEIVIDINLHISGILIKPHMMPEGGIVVATDNYLNAFVEYAKNSKN